jgi:hypothetical protein
MGPNDGSARRLGRSSSHKAARSAGRSRVRRGGGSMSITTTTEPGSTETTTMRAAVMLRALASSWRKSVLLKSVP